MYSDIAGTKDTLLTGFGFEGMSARERPEFMKRAMTYLGVLNPGGQPGGGGTPGPSATSVPSAVR